MKFGIGDFTEFCQETPDLLKVRKKMSATLHEDKRVCPLVCSNVGSATKLRIHCCATMGVITAFITLLTATCLRGVPMTTVVTRTPHNTTFPYVACLILFNFVVIFVLKSVHVKEFEVLTAETKQLLSSGV